ncbi:MAG: hypothetical protein Q9219_007182 [cf. Caloplaca sp. 3 TL-2023]
MVDPEVQADTTKEKILAAFTAGLSLLSVPGVSSVIEAAVGATIGGILTTALQQAPSVAGAIWPSGDAASQVIQIGELQTALSEINSDLSDMLQAGLTNIMDGQDTSVFANFASSGAFSGPELLSLPEQTKGLDLAFKTYLVTTAMAANDWQVMLGPPYDENSKFNSTPKSQGANFNCNYKIDTGVCDTLDSKGVAPTCQPGGWSEYTSPVSKRSYYANQKNGKNNPSSGAMVNAIVQKEWSALTLLFDGAYDCNRLDSGPKNKPIVSFTGDGRFNFNCLSQLEVHNGCKDDLTGGSQQFQYRDVIFGVAPLMHPAGRRLTWVDAVEIVRAFELKAQREGYRDRWAKIEMTEGGELVGTARISSEDLSRSRKNLPAIVSRVDPPRQISKVVRTNGPGIPDDTLSFTFDDIPMAADDVTIAIVSASKLACNMLSQLSGQDTKPVPGPFRVKDYWYRFELAWDQQSDSPLTMSEVKTVISTLFEVGQIYNMRQFTFEYRLRGRFHAVGRLRNPISRPPPRRIAVEAKQMNIPSGQVVWSDFGSRMDYRNVAFGMLGLLDNSWGCMVENERSADRIRARNDPFTFHDSRHSFRLQIFGPQGDKLSLDDLINMANFVVEFGRLYYMREHHCTYIDTYYPAPRIVTASIVQGLVESQ